MKRPFLYVVIPFCVGIVVSGFLNIPALYSVVPSVIFLVLAILKRSQKIISHLLLYLAILFFGIFYYQNSVILPHGHISEFAQDKPEKALLQGVISDDPTVSVTPYHKLKTVFTLNAYSIKIDEIWRPSRGLAGVSVYETVEKPLHFGQKVILDGVLSKPAGLKNPGLFDYSKYLALKDICAVFKAREASSVEIISDDISNPVKAMAYRIRNWMRAAIDRYFESPYGGFIKAIMIGDKVDLAYGLNNDFIKTGTVHAIAISGLNVGMIAVIFMGLLALFRIPKKLNLAFTACAMVLYAFIAGSNPPIVRAVIIYIVFVIGYLMNRESDMINSLSFAALIMLLMNPKQIFDPSFQLSFISVAGMILLTPKINAMLHIDEIKRDSFPERLSYYLLSAISVSISASIAAWPVVAYYFNIVSPVAVIANLVVVPALFFLTAGSFLFLLSSAFSGFLAGFISQGLSFFCAGLFNVNHVLASLPFSYIRAAAPSLIFMVIYYLAIIAILAPLFNKLKQGSGIIIAALALINLVVWNDAAATIMNGDVLRITLMDVGHGDSSLIELPDGKKILIDAGSGGDEEAFDAGRSIAAPYLWNKKIGKIDIVIATHFDKDHVGGIVYMLENFKVGLVVDNGASCEGSEIYDKYLRAIRDKGIARTVVSSGDAISFESGKIDVLNPVNSEVAKDGNEDSLVLKMRYKNFSALFCGDAIGVTLERLTEHYGDYLESDIIKVPHHGGDAGSESIVKNFIDTVRASFAIISNDRMDGYTAASQRMLETLRDSNIVTYRTGEVGAVVITVGDMSYDVKPYIRKN